MVNKFPSKRTRVNFELLQAIHENPPRPLQVYEYGASSREQFNRNKQKYKWQWVCLINAEGDGEWHRRRTPRRWKGTKPPFHVRIIRPNFVGMLYYLQKKGKARIEWVEEDVDVGEGRTERRLVHKILPA